MKKLLNIEEVYRLNSENEVKEFIEEQKKKSIEGGYILTSYSSKLQEKKDRKTKDVIDSGYLVKIGKTYDEFWEV